MSVEGVEAGRAGGRAVDLADVTIAFPVAQGSYTAVERASLSVADGEFVAIVGPRPASLLR
jgi:NitT/TauT family transport system ATP-binding protein